MSLQSGLTNARTGSTSLRATIPEGIVAFLEVKEGDKLDWKMKITEDGERVVLVKKYDPDEIERIIRKYKRKK